MNSILYGCTDTGQLNRRHIACRVSDIADLFCRQSQPHKQSLDCGLLILCTKDRRLHPETLCHIVRDRRILAGYKGELKPCSAGNADGIQITKTDCLALSAILINTDGAVCHDAVHICKDVFDFSHAYPLSFLRTAISAGLRVFFPVPSADSISRISRTSAFSGSGSIDAF